MKRARSDDSSSIRICPYAGETQDSIDESNKWSRSKLPENFSAATHSVIMQQMDIGYVIEDNEAVIKVYGCSQEGYSVALSVYKFLPYIYVPIPTNIKIGLSHETLCNNLKTAFNKRMMARTKGYREGYEFIHSVVIEDRIPIMYYQETTSPFFKIIFTLPTHVTQGRSILEEGFPVEGILTVSPFFTYESNIAYILQFMVDYKIGGASWIELPAGKYSLVNTRRCNTTIEATIHCDDLVVYSVDDVQWSGIAPLRILSFDIECAAKPGRFPDPTLDPVIQIANYVSVHGQEKPIINNIFVLNTCTPILGVDVRCFRTEKELLAAWSEFVRLTDPDILTGYNIVNFDFGYLCDRAAALGLTGFNFFTRVNEKRVSVKDTTFSSAQTGTRESKEWSIEGRIVFDMYQVIQRDYKLSSYTLNNVSSHFLKQQKEDVHHSMITVLHESEHADDRRRLAVYCCKDAYLPQKLMDSLMSLTNYVEMARVTGVPFTYLLTRGQGIKVTSQILRKAKEMNLLLPTTKTHVESTGYKGATVIDPYTGFYDTPIFTLDFMSLYPSIMQAHNLCYTTLIEPGTPTTLIKDVDYEVTPTGDRFIKSDKKRGILPLILDALLGARRNAKKLMAEAHEAGDKFKEQVYNARQLALKVSANSVYGFTGQATGPMACVAISASVTSYGREMIVKTREVVESHYTIANGYPTDAKVIYGDTDSVMVCAGVATVAEAIRIGLEAAQLVTKCFPFPIKLEFEKVYYPWLLMAKKKYAGLFWTNANTFDKMDCKGIESVRRDNCGIARHVVATSLRKILIDKNIPAAIDFCKGVICDILMNRIDLSLLIITKAFSRSEDAYKNPQPHIILAKKMRLRDAATAPSVGDRIPYVVVKGDKNSKVTERAEDPLYVLENDVPIDSDYYIDQLISPLVRIFTPIMENPESVFRYGDHTKSLVIPIQKDKEGKIKNWGNFTVIRETCLGCRAVLATNEKTLCNYCRLNAPDIYAKYLMNSKIKETEFNRLWIQCQQCQGSFHQEVICSANDCPIFYKRTKARKEYMNAVQTLTKFNLDW